MNRSRSRRIGARSTPGPEGLLGAILRTLEPDHEPTEADLRMMDGIEAELAAFATEVEAGRA